MRNRYVRRKWKWDDSEAALRCFAGEEPDTDDEDRGAALDFLYKQAQNRIDTYLRHRCGVNDAALRADILQAVFTRIWEGRDRFTNRGAAAWFAFLCQSTRNAWLDYVRRVHDVPWPQNESGESLDWPDGKTTFTITLLAEAEADYFMSLADRLFLELDPSIPDAEHDLRLLAAQMYYLDQDPWEVIVRRLGPAASVAGTPLTRETLDGWLDDPGVLRHLAATALYWENDRLAAILLCPKQPPSPVRLDALYREATEAYRQGHATADSPFPPWTWGEALVLLWRCRNALLREQVLAQRHCSYSPQELDAFCDKLQACYPFQKIMGELLEQVGPSLRGACARMGVWQRLALQYRLWDELPHQDILDRIADAARCVDVTLNANQLNVWLSNGRLLSRLARYTLRWREEHIQADAHTG